MQSCYTNNSFYASAGNFAVNLFTKVFILRNFWGVIEIEVGEGCRKYMGNLLDYYLAAIDYPGRVKHQ